MPITHDPDEHGVAEGYYDLLRGCVALVCLCDETFCGENWEEAGASLDEHIEGLTDVK